jgi:uncharacterized protein YbjT (DUF2867 family)
MILITGATGNNGAELTKRLAGSMARFARWCENTLRRLMRY